MCLQHALGAQSFLAGTPGDEAMSGDSLTVRVPPPVTFGDVSVSETAVTAPGLAAVTLASVEDVTIAALPDPTTRVEIGSDGSLIISDIAASSGKADQLFIAGSPGADGLLGTADDQVIVRDTGAQFENLTPNGISNGLHEISIPVSDVSGGLIVNVADDDDSVVLTDLPFSATVSGGAGADSLDGSQAEMPVELDGGTGNDLLAGSSANDRLVDGPGDDHLSGGGGDDEFVLTPGSDDVVTDSGGSDVLNFSLAAAGITLDLDAVGIPQAVDASGNTVQLEGEFEGFVGSVFDDEVSTRAIDRLRRIAGGGFSSAGDRLIVDAQSRAAGDDGLRVAVSGQAAIEYQGSVQNVTVNNALNEAPVARFDDATTRLGQPVTIGVLGNDSDFNGDALTVDSVTTPANGAASINPDGTIEYTPEDGFAGADTFSYEISDSSGATSTASVTVTVTEPPRVTLPDAGGDFEITAENGRVVVRDGSGSEVGNAQLTAGDSLLINGASGDDSLTLDLSVLSGLNIDRVVFDGLAGFDTLTVTGGSFGAATIDLTNPTDGRIQLDGTTIDFRGLEPVDLTGTTATDVVLNLPDGGVRAVLEPFAAGQLRLRSTDPLPAFEETIFAIPSGNVTVNGGDGDDLIDASGAGIGLVVNGAGGSDVLIGSSLADTLSGNAGADRIEAGAGDDVLLGGTENDTLIGNSGDDDLRGEAGDDVLSGGAGSDVLVGSDGDDWLRGQGASGDVLSGGLGNDHLDGGAGTDRLIESGNVNFTATDHSLTGLGDDLMAGIEFLRLTGGVSDNSIDAGAFSGNVVLNGRGGDDLLIGGAGNDNINGGAGRDTLVGNAGNDRLRGQGSTGDKISGGLGDDTLDGGAGNDQLIETGDADFELSDSALTGLGNDLVIGIERAVLRGGGSDNRIDASSFSGAVALLGFGGADTLLGGASNDRLRGAAGRDLLIGGPGNDALFGQGSSGDTLEGGPGADLLDGGSGGDRLISDELDTVINDALDVILGP